MKILMDMDMANMVTMVIVGDGDNEYNDDGEPDNPRTWRQTPRALGCAGFCATPPRKNHDF